ncbi:MAG: ABC transporter substrate-binding protein [Bacillota bacterium]|nr:ABC transporter substrate-binding protein [Bacillota bacterium]
MKHRLFSKGLHIVLILALMLMMSACGNSQAAPNTTQAPSAQATTPAPTTASEAPTTAAPTETTTEPAPQKFVLEYPADMKEKGFTEPVVFDKMPERVVCLTVAPVPALYELGVNLVGVPMSRVIQWPEDLTKNTTLVKFNAHSPEDFDFESLVVLEPDLVILSSGAADTAGKKLVEEFKLPVYYVMGGHTVKYESVKLQTQELVKAFGHGKAAEAGKVILKRFEDLENKVKKSQEAFKGLKVMVLTSGGDRHFIQTKGGTLGSMLDMLGFENVFENEGNSMVQLDREQALSYDPDYVVAVGGTTPEEHKEMMEKVFAEHPDYWNAIPAIKEGKVLYLGIEYIANTGTHVVEHIEKLVDLMYQLTGIEPK